LGSGCKAQAVTRLEMILVGDACLVGGSFGCMPVYTVVVILVTHSVS